MVFIITAPYAIQLICLAMLFVGRGLPINACQVTIQRYVQKTAKTTGLDLFS